MTLRCNHCGMSQKKGTVIDPTKRPYWSVCDYCTYPNTLYSAEQKSKKNKEVFRY